MNEKTFSTNLKADDLKDWGDLLSAVCERPRMFVNSDNLQSVLDFVGGYLFAQSLLSPEQESEWRQFNYWLAEKFDYPRNYAWYYARNYFANDEDALKAFPLLLTEFRGG